MHCLSKLMYMLQCLEIYKQSCDSKNVVPLSDMHFHIYVPYQYSEDYILTKNCTDDKDTEKALTTVGFGWFFALKKLCFIMSSI